MNRQRHKLSRRILAMLLAAAMLVTMFPAAMFAVEQDETIVANESIGVTDDTNQNDLSDDQNVSDTSGNEENIGEGNAEADTLPPAENDVGTVNINASMIQEEVDKLVEGASTIVVEEGDYGIEGENNHIKLTLSKGNQTVQLKENGMYHRLMIVVLSKENILQANGATIDGDVDTVYNQSPMIYIPYGSLELQGTLSITNHDYGVILGYTNATTENAKLSLAENAMLNITDCKSVNGNGSYDNGVVCGGTDYFSYVDSQGDGTCGSAITTKGKGTAELVVGPHAILDIQKNEGSAIYSITVQKFILDIKNNAVVSLNESYQGLNMNTDYTGEVYVGVDQARLSIENNRNNGITGQDKPYLLDIKNGSTVNVNNNGAIGINNFYLKVVDHSILNVSNNVTHGATNIGLNVTDSTMTCNGNGYYGIYVTKYLEDKNATEISDSIITTNGNGKPSSNNAGFAGEMKVVLENSVLYSDSAGGYNLYNDADAPATLHISGTDVVVLHGDENGTNAKLQDIFDDWNTKGNTGRVYVTGGSLQANSQNITKGFEQSLNQLIPEVDGTTDKGVVQYGAPINQNSTALTRFDLHQGINTVVNQDVNTFAVSDPNGDDYGYMFRYNTNEEDLTGTGGNAYIWAPVTMIHYDATEGNIADFGTSQGGDKTINSTRGDGSSLNNKPVVENESYIDATDYTICGNSLALSEGVLPTAIRTGLSFEGWYYAVGDDVEKAEEYAKEEKFEALYTLLQENGRQFDISTLTDDDNVDVENITLYAVWSQEKVTVTPADITVYTGGAGYDSVMTGEGEVTTEASGLPTPGYLITLPESINDKYFDGDSIAADLSGQIRFVYDGNDDGNYTTEGKDRVWNLEMYSDGDSQTAVGEDGIARYVYRMDADSLSGEPIRMLFSNNGEEITSDDFTISLENGLYRTYGMTIYPGLLDSDAIKAQVLVNGTVVVDDLDVEVGTATLTVRGTTNAEDINAVGNDTDAVAENDHHITAVAPTDTQYYINESQVEVDPDNVSLLSDALVDTDPLKEYMVDNNIAESDENYEYRYLDLVDNTNGNAYVAATKPVDVYWALPEGADSDDDFRIVHFNALDREYTDLDQMLAGNKPVVYTMGDDLEIVEIDHEYYLKFSTDSFSPFVLVWEENDPYIPPSTGDDDDPDTPALDRVNHFLYVEGYPEDYRTGEYSDNEDLWPVKPQGNITRAEVATIFYRLLKDEVREEIETDVNSFPDVNKDDWFNITVSSLANMGAISGYEDGTFRPNEPISRAELAAMAVRFYDTFEAEYEEGTFLDVDGDEWYADAIAAAEELGIIGGYPDGTVRPEANITRAETCAIVNRVLERRPHDDHLGDADDMRTWPDNQPGAWYYADMQEATNGHYYEWIDIDGSKFEEWTEVDKDYDWTKR